MARGKYKSQSEARRAREDALDSSADANRKLVLATAENERLKARVNELELSTAAIVTARIAEFTTRIDSLEEDRKQHLEVLKTAGECIRAGYEYAIRQGAALGASPKIAVDQADQAFTGFVIKGEWVPTSRATVSIDKNNLRVLKIGKTPDERQGLRTRSGWTAGQKVLDKESAGMNRQLQVGN